MSVKLKLNNAVINGSFDFWQRGTSFTGTNNIYTADRFLGSRIGTMVYNVTRSTDVPASSSSQYSLSVAVTTAQANLGTSNFGDLRQLIEGNVLRTFKGKKTVLSFWVKSSKVGTFSLGYRNVDGTRSYISEYSINQPNVWEKKTIRVQHDPTGNWNYENGLGLMVRWSLGHGTDFQGQTNTWLNANFIGSSNQANLFDTIGNTFQLADVVLVEDNEGQTREPEFMYAGRDYAEELQLCERYHSRHQFQYRGIAFGGGRFIVNIPYRVAMRVSPGVSTTAVNRDGQFLTFNAIINGGTDKMAQTFTDAGIGPSTVDSDWSGTIIADAEL